MNESTILWIFGTLIAAISVVVGFLGKWIRDVSKELGDFRAEVPKTYPSEGDIKRVEDAIKEVGREVRGELNAFTREVREDIGKLAATVHQMVGANQNRG